MRYLRFAGLAALLCTMLLAEGIVPQPVSAANAVVSGETCTRADLAAAITTASNGSTVTFDCENPVITFAAAEQIEIGDGDSVTIDGSNGGNQIILRGGGDEYLTRFFSVESGGTLTVQHLTMQDGNGPVEFYRDTTDEVLAGGAIYNDGGTLAVFASTFHDNYADGLGGAIYNTNDGTLTITESRFEGNTADSNGGAITNDLGSTTIRRSTFVDNDSERFGGAIMAYDGPSLDVIASTFSGNTATLIGSAIAVEEFMDSATIRWSTIIQPENTVPALYMESPLTLEGVILGGSRPHCVVDGGALIDSYSLSNDASCTLEGDGSDDGITYLDGLTNLGLGPLSTVTINGVDQSYYPLLASSHAINGGPTTGCDTGTLPATDPEPDQLGAPRPTINSLEHCDIGAIEAQRFTISEGVPYEYFTAAAENDSPNYAADCDTSDGMTPVPSGTDHITCMYPDNGLYLGIVLVQDGAITTSARSLAAKVSNVEPDNVTIIPGTTVAVVNQGVPIQLSATDVPADVLTFTFYCGNSPVGVLGGITSNDGIFSTTGYCAYPVPGEYHLYGFATDDDGGESTPMATATILVVFPANLCANRWNGQLSMADDGDCSRSETLIELPWDAPLNLCVNNWNGTTRASDDCGRSETTMLAYGDDSISICVNRWNDGIRVSDHCSRSEYADTL